MKLLDSTKKIFILLLVLPLAGCSFVAQLSDGNGTSDSDAPKSIELDNPAEAISNNPRPRVVVGGIKEGDTIAIYTDALCSEQSKVASSVATSDSVTVELESDLSVEGTYQFFSKKVSKAGVVSECSTTSTNYVLDLTAPVKATTISWQETSPSITLPVHPTWTKSVSTDLSLQKIQYYSDSSCGTKFGSEVSLESSLQITSFTTSTDGTYTYELISQDTAGNKSTSDCSTAMAINANGPQILNVTLPANGTYSLGDSLFVKINYNTDLNISGSERLLNLTIGSNTYTMWPNTLNCTDTKAVCFNATITNVEDEDTDGISLGSSVTLGADTITDVVTSTNVPITLPALNTAGILVKSPPKVKMSTLDTIILETQTSFTFDVSLTKAWHETITVPYKVLGTANSSDHSLTSGTITFSPGQTLKSISFNIINDASVDPEETISIFLNKPSNAYLDTRADLFLLLKESAALNIIHADAHENNVCSVSIDLVAKCWGANGSAQISSPATTTPITFATTVQTSVKQIGVGTAHICVLKSDDTVFCKGLNDVGQIGDNIATTPRTAFDAAPQLSNVAKIDVAAKLSCAITKSPDNDLYCWGHNTNKQINSAATTLYRVATAVITATDVLDVSTDGYTVCAILTGGELKCWGRNANGQVGTGATTPANIDTPTTIIASSVASVSVSNSTVCAVMQTTGELKCWGSNGGSASRIGANLTSTNVLTPTTVIASDVRQAQISLANGCAIKTDNTLWCWGSRSYESFYYNTSASGYKTPIQVDIGDAKTLVLTPNSTASFPVSCYISTGNQLKCTARNSFGQGGQGYLTTNTSPISTGFTADKIFMHSGNTCAISTSGEMSCWGASGANAQLGDTNFLSRAYPVENMLTNISKVFMSTGFSYAIANDNKFYAWGSSWFTHLGGKTQSTATLPKLQHTTPVIEARPGVEHMCALYANGSVGCRGNDFNGRLGPSTTIVDGENQVFASGISSIAVSSIHNCAIKSIDGTVWCWGSGTDGKLGNSGTAHATIPVQAIGLTDIVEISTQEIHNCALKNDGSVWCWGDGASGKIGNAASSDVSTPVSVIGSGAKKVVAGGTHTCAIVGVNNDLHCWGSNSSGQLGDGTTTSSNIPKVILSGVKDVALGASSTCAIMISDSSVRCWGDNTSGTLGNYEHRGYRIVRNIH